MPHTLELPDAIYAALQHAAEQVGKTPVDWIAARLPRIDEAQETAAPTSLADLFEGRLGRIRSGGKTNWSEGCEEKFADDLERKRRTCKV